MLPRYPVRIYTERKRPRRRAFFFLIIAATQYKQHTNFFFFSKYLTENYVTLHSLSLSANVPQMSTYNGNCGYNLVAMCGCDWSISAITSVHASTWCHKFHLQICNQYKRSLNPRIFLLIESKLKFCHDMFLLFCRKDTDII